MLYARRPDVVTDHITACFVLHNFVILNGEPILRVSISIQISVLVLQSSVVTHCLIYRRERWIIMPMEMKMKERTMLLITCLKHLHKEELKNESTL